MKDIPEYKNFKKIEPVNKGWSSDEKYYIEIKNSEKLLLRVFNILEITRCFRRLRRNDKSCSKVVFE